MVDYLIILITLTILKMTKSTLRIFLATTFGTIGAVLMPIIPFAIAVTIRILLAPIMVFTMCKFQNIKKFILTLLSFVFVTFTLGGVIMGLFNMTMSKNFLFMNYPQGGLIGFTAFGLILTYYFFMQLMNYMKSKKSSQAIYDVDILSKETGKRMKAFYDSGNCLYDIRSNPVMIFSNSKIDFLNKNFKQDDDIKIKTISNEYISHTYKIDKVIIHKGKEAVTLLNVKTAISNNDFNGYSLLLHKEML